VLLVQCVGQEARGRTILDLGSGVFAKKLLLGKKPVVPGIYFAFLFKLQTPNPSGHT